MAGSDEVNADEYHAKYDRNWIEDIGMQIDETVIENAPAEVIFFGTEESHDEYSDKEWPPAMHGFLMALFGTENWEVSYYNIEGQQYFTVASKFKIGEAIL